MKVSVILCTYNRSESLAKALASVARSKIPESIQWEVLVVDNNSGDQTKEVVEEFSRQYPSRFRYLFERKQGKSYALNTGIRESNGDILAFTDDDVIVEPAWLMNLTSALGESEWAGVGGRVLPDRNFMPPCWIPQEDRYPFGPLAMFDLGPSAFELSEPPFGNNMAYRRSAFDSHGGFRTDLGPCPGSEIRSEDTEFGIRVLNAGGRLRYEPSAVVCHTVPESRVKKDYFLRWWFDKARADVRAHGAPPEAKWRLAGVPLILLRRFAVWTLRWFVSVNPSRRFSSKLKVWIVAGQIKECWYVSHQVQMGRGEQLE
jgi:glycosyltransferase involved in cell wall biosynthesis